MTSDCKRPRILQAITHLALGGAERVAFNLIRGLRDRCDFAVYAANGVDAGPVGQSMRSELDEMGIPLHVGTSVPIKFGGMGLAGFWFGRAVKRFTPDVIHLHTEIPEASYAAMVTLRPSLGRVPLVRTIHNTIYWDPWRKLGRWCDAKMPRSYVACVSQGAVKAFDDLRRDSGAGPVPVQPRVIFNGVSVRRERPSRNIVGDQPIRVLFAGRFEQQKGADLLPEIIRRVTPRQPVELCIYGSGTYEPALKQLAVSPANRWRISVNGAIPSLTDQMADFDLMIMPSRYEGLALLAIEAAFVGLPVIATDGPGLREGFPSDYPWLARAGDAESFASLVQQALDDPERWHAVVQQARAYARVHFDINAMCVSYEELYREAMRQ